MKGKRLTALTMAAMLGVSAVQPVWAADWHNGNPLIAHALGEADGKVETNSREAFINSWNNGYRVVEGDFIYSSDGVLVMRHDFKEDGSYYRLEIETNGDVVMDSKTFTETPVIYEQTPLRAVDLMYLMVEYPDMYLVTDTKSADKAMVQRQFNDLKTIAANIGHPEVLDRIIPQIYKKDMLGWVKEIHPFQNWIYTLYLDTNPDYQDIAAFCAANGVDTVALHLNRAAKENVGILKASGLKVYAHTINRYLVFEELLEKGVDGIYTDRIKPYELEWVGLENGIKTVEQTMTVDGKEMTFTTLDIFGETHAPLRQLAQAGKGMAATYDKAAGTLNLQPGKKFVSLGNEMLMDGSGRLITKKADFQTLVDGQPSDLQCFLVDGEVFVSVEKALALVQKTQ